METSVKSFTSSWWAAFIEANKKFSQACVIKDAIDSTLLEQLNRGIVEIIYERFKLESIGRGFRVYLDGLEQNDAFLRNLSKDLPLMDESIVDYSKRIFKTKFGIIINSGEKHSDILSEQVLNIMQPLIDSIGLPASGLEITVFIGDYGWTPLGIHQDHRGENVIHFHLGPAKKTMFIWDEKKYDELTGTKFNNMDIEPILEHAEKYPFEMGDVYYMPWNKFHVGYSDELSVGITLWFNNPTKYGYVNKVLESFIFQYVEENKDILTPQLNYLKNSNTFTDFISTLKLDDNALRTSTSGFFKNIYEEYKYSLMSNGGWQSVPLSLEEKTNYKVDNYEHLLNKKVLSKKPFRIYYKKHKETLQIYVRGSKIEIRYHKELVSIINKLNTNNTFYVKDLIKKLSIDWPTEAGLYFLSLLYDKRGIEAIQ